MSSEFIDEVIVVNDSSTDNTQEVIDDFEDTKLQKIHLQENVGKTKAIFEWLKQAHWDYIILIDSDLIGFTVENLEALIKPILQDETDVTLSIRENSLKTYKWLGTDFVTGERVVPRILFDDVIYYTSWPRFGLEVKMNEKILEKGYRMKNIFFPWVITPRKTYKMWYIQWTISDLKMVIDILSIFPIWKLLRQIWKFSRFSQKQ